MTLHGCTFTGKLIEKFGPGHHRRGISDDLAFRELYILSTFGVHRSSGKRDERTSCIRERVVIWLMSRIIQYTAEQNTYNYSIPTQTIPNSVSNWSYFQGGLPRLLLTLQASNK